MKLPTRIMRGNGVKPASNFLNPLFESAWDPFTEMATLRRTMNSVLDSALSPLGSIGESTASAPAVDLYEKDGTYRVECAVPGLKKEDIDIEIADNRLTISAKREEEKSEGDQNSRYFYRELRRGSFQRTIAFPEEIAAEQVSASYENGILALSVPTTKPAKAKKVAING